MRFLRDAEGRFIRIDRVCEAQPDQPGFLKLRLDSGDQRQVTVREWDRVTELLESHIVPAAPGTVQLFDVKGEGRRWIVKQPVIAWAVQHNGIAAAITSTGIIRGNDIYPAIQNPNGSVEDALGLYESYEHWLAAIAVE